MTRRHCLLVLLSCVAAVICSCHEGDKPVDPAWGKVGCAHCKMLVQDKRYAAQIVTDDGTRVFFDDIGCMIAYADEEKLRVRHYWVHDETGPNWLDAEHARFRRGAQTPMDYGFAAGPSGTLDFAEVRKEALARARRRS